MNILAKTGLKETIFHELNQIEIFSRYTTIPESEIAECLDKKTRKTSNLMRVDPNPSVGFQWKLDSRIGEYKIRMWDFANSYWRGDVIDIVGKVLNLNSCNAQDFIVICEHIITNCHKEHPVEQSEIVIQPTGGILLTNFGLEFRECNKQDLQYWGRAGLDKNDLTIGKVYFINQYWIVGKNIVNYRYNSKDVCYGYLLDVIHNTLIWKLYFINRGRNDNKRARFITNNIYPLEAMHELVPALVLVITKSRGDCLVIRKLVSQALAHASLLSTGVGEITVTITNLTSETTRLPKLLVNELRKTYKYIFFNTDFDPEGIRSAKYHLKNYGIQPLFLTNGRGGTKDYGAKDTKDYRVKFGEAKSVKLIETIILKLISDIEKVDNMKL